jgi:hypothetical protein
LELGPPAFYELGYSLVSNFAFEQLCNMWTGGLSVWQYLLNGRCLEDSVIVALNGSALLNSCALGRRSALDYAKTSSECATSDSAH